MDPQIETTERDETAAAEELAPVIAPEEAEEEDAVAEVQSIDTFNSLEDGQPGAPGHLAFQFVVGADHGSGKDFGFVAGPELAFTPRSPSPFLTNLELTGGLELEGDAEVLQPALDLAWGQRWWSNGTGGRWVPTLGSMTEVNLPLVSGFGPGLSGDNLSETVTLVEQLGPGSVYVNAVATGVLGDEPDQRHLVLAARAGYKWIALEDKFTVIVDYVLEQNEARSGRASNTAELSMEWVVGEHLALGPGLVVGLDANPETPRFGGGILFLVE